MGKALIIGRGEIGTALAEVLGQAHEIQAYDAKDGDPPDLGWTKPYIMHVCYPHNEHFVWSVRQYRNRYLPTYTVIHSTVPVGTSTRCGALHSPVIGLHPNLVPALRTFTKFLGGPHSDDVCRHLQAAGIKVRLVDKPETTELMKLLSTLKRAVDVEFTKEVKAMCDDLGVPFEAWTLWTDNYNTSYAALGHPEFARPNLIPMMSRLGGHCLLPNCELLESDFVTLVKRRNR